MARQEILIDRGGDATIKTETGKPVKVVQRPQGYLEGIGFRKPSITEIDTGAGKVKVDTRRRVATITGGGGTTVEVPIIEGFQLVPQRARTAVSVEAGKVTVGTK